MTPSLARLVDPHASAAPTRPALVHEGQVITYGDLARGRDALRVEGPGRASAASGSR
jgi:hypothetical protein